MNQIQIQMWSCEYCTYNNQVEFEICDICGVGERPAFEVIPLENVLMLSPSLYESSSLKNLDDFIQPYILHNNQHHSEFDDRTYTKEDIVSILRKLFEKTCECVECYSRALNIMITRELNGEDTDMNICNDIIKPVVINILQTKFLVDTGIIYQSTLEGWQLEQKSKPNPASKTVIEKLRALPRSSGKENTCFCAVTDNSSDIVQLQCCSNAKFHLKCIEKWFKTNGTCPMCRKTPFLKSSLPSEKVVKKNCLSISVETIDNNKK